MTQVLAVVGGGAQGLHAVLAGEALRKAAQRRRQAFEVELRGKGVGGHPLSAAAIAGADTVLLIGEGDLGEGRFGAMRRARIRIEDVLTDAHAVLDRVLSGEAGAAPATASRTIVAVTSCPTGIAHTFMAAEGIQAAAQALGYAVRVETQGSVGARDALTPEEIAAADLVLIAATPGSTAPALPANGSMPPTPRRRSATARA